MNFKFFNQLIGKIKIMAKLPFIFLLLITFKFSFGQSDKFFLKDRSKYCIVDKLDTVKLSSTFSIGSRHSGIGLGNFGNYNGLKFSIQDYDSINNGISLNLMTNYPSYKTTNGLQISILLSHLEKLNGLYLGVIGSSIDLTNGIALTGIFSECTLTNGIQLTAILTRTYYINGICISGISNRILVQNGLLIAGIKNKVESISNGIAISGILNETENFNGLCIAAFNKTEEGKGVQIGIINKAENLKGIQFGLININDRNKYFKFFPFVNFSFRKDNF